MCELLQSLFFAIIEHIYNSALKSLFLWYSPSSFFTVFLDPFFRGFTEKKNSRYGEKKFTLQLYILFRVVWVPQRRVIRRSNGNFVGFPRIIMKIVKNYVMKHNLHFSGKWQNRQISQFSRYWWIWDQYPNYESYLGQGPSLRP